MLTAGMNGSEARKEIISDLANVIAVSDRKQHQVDRAVMKSSRFPVKMYCFITSKQKNRWLLLWHANSKKQTGDNIIFHTVCIHHTSHGRYAYKPLEMYGKIYIAVYPPHFFSRFAERMGIDLTGEDLIRRYFYENADFSVTYDKAIVDENYYEILASGTTKEGVMLGLKPNEQNMILFKTFITYDMCSDEQIEELAKNERIRKEIHE